MPSVFPAAVVPQAPEDPLFGLSAAFKSDPSPTKVDLVIGAYRDNDGKPWVLPVVKKVKQQFLDDPAFNHEYLSITGLPEFTTASQKLVFGADSQAVKDGRIGSVQSISGTGALHLGGLFISRFYNNIKPDFSNSQSSSQDKHHVYISNPTWVNHRQIFQTVGFTVTEYPYFSVDTNGLDFDGMAASIESAPTGSVILLHACAHNPTGVDLTHEQWVKIADIVEKRNHFTFFDTAYQGFASGDLAADAASIRLFADRGLEFVVAQSYAKNMGLYGERAGCFHYVAPKSVPASDVASHVARVKSQLALIIRAEISNPPAFGARIVATVLNSPTLFAEWEDHLKTMSGRIHSMRTALRTALDQKVAADPSVIPERYRKWNHITDQIGMFSFTGLTKPHVDRLRSEYHIYMTGNGRVSMAGFNTKNVEYVADAIIKTVSSDGKL